MNDLVNLVVPPPDADQGAQRNYQLRVTLVACSAFCGLVGFLALSLGFIPWLFVGFARADEVQSLRTDAARHWSFELSSSILDFRLKQCLASSDEAKSLYASEIQRRVSEYQTLTGQAYQLPSCGDL